MLIKHINKAVSSPEKFSVDVTSLKVNIALEMGRGQAFLSHHRPKNTVCEGTLSPSLSEGGVLDWTPSSAQC